MAYSKSEKDKIFKKIFDSLSKGEALRNILKEECFPSTVTFYKWIDDDDDKAKQYARACEDRADAIFEDILDIADNGEDDVIEMDLGDGLVVEKTNNEVIQRSKLRVDARKWMLSKMNPKKYGDKIDHTTDGDKINDTKQINISYKGKDVDLSS